VGLGGNLAEIGKNMFDFSAKASEADILNNCTGCPQSMQDNPNTFLAAVDIVSTAWLGKDALVIAGKGAAAGLKALIGDWAKGAGVADDLAVNSDALLPDADFLGRGVVRSDLEDHLINARVIGKQISGGHDLTNFNIALNEVGGTVLTKVEKGPGIYEIQYQLSNSTKIATKTVFDPLVYPNMSEMANTAANRALTQYQLTGSLSQEIVVNNVRFSVPITIRNGQPYVPTAYAVGVVK